MASNGQDFQPFQGKSILVYQEERNRKVREEIENRTENDIRRADVSALVNTIVQQHELKAPTLEFDSISEPTSSERTIEDEGPFGMIARQLGNARLVRRQVITYHVRMKGDPELLRLQPQSSTLSAPQLISVWPIAGAEHEVRFDIVRPSNDPAQAEQDATYVKQQAQDMLNYLRTYGGNLANDISNYNTSLRQLVEQLVAARKKRLQDNDSFLSLL